MSSEPGRNRIDDEAAQWAARIDRAPLDETRRQAFDAWCAQDRRHLGAFARAQAVLERTARARALGAAFLPDDPPAAPQAPVLPSHRPRRRTPAWALAAGLCAGAVALGSWWWAPPPSTQTAKGEVRMLPLPDGSTVTLNTASQIRTRFSDERRLVELLRGEVLFDVAKDSARPFVVRAGDTTVRAVGTSFSVRHLPGAPVRVLVRSGVVEVTREGSDQALRTTGQQLLEQTAVAAASPDRTALAAAPFVGRGLDEREVTRQLAWREGLLSFEGVPLSEAAAEFERYSDLRIVIVQPELSRARITGLFAANNPRGFASAAALTLNARVTEHGRELRLSR